MIKDDEILDEETLTAIYEGIRGDGELNWLHSPGMSTDPTVDDLHHRACLELETRGLVRRERETEEYIFWLAGAPPTT